MCGTWHVSAGILGKRCVHCGVAWQFLSSLVLRYIVLWSDVCVVVKDGGHLEVAVCQRERDGQ